MRISGLTALVPGICRRAFGTGNKSGTQNQECALPENPFNQINPTNPSSWYSGISKFMSGLLKSETCVEHDLTNGILNADPNHNPQDSIFKKFQISALLGRMYTLLEWVNELAKQNKQALKDTHGLALAAK